IVASHGKRLVGWDEVASANLEPGSLIQLWRPLWSEVDASDAADSGTAADSATIARRAALARFRAGIDRSIDAGATVILSPADRLYLDMKYEPATVPGLSWAAYVDERRAYDWDIAAIFAGIPEESIAGIEAPIWTE